MVQVQSESDLVEKDIIDKLNKLTAKSVLCIGIIVKEQLIPQSDRIKEIIEEHHIGKFEIISIKPNKQCLALLFDIETGSSKRLNVTILPDDNDEDDKDE